jgi:putative nucleotidyltransferase with HDIG domain
MTVNIETDARRQHLLAKVENMGSLPSVEAIVKPLVSYFQQPLEHIDTQRIVDLISHDNSLAAQCLRMANSPLFGRWQAITTARAAVMALGMQRMREIAVSCCVLKLLPDAPPGDNPIVFWEHSLACALLCRRIAKKIGCRDPEQAYLAGLLHDLGLIVNYSVAPELVQQVLFDVIQTGKTLVAAETELFGFSHCESGYLIARRWNLHPAIMDVIKHHHRMTQLSDHRPLLALVSLADRLCRLHSLGYGYDESELIQWGTDEELEIVAESWPIARNLNWTIFAEELADYLADAKRLVSVLYRSPSN